MTASWRDTHPFLDMRPDLRKASHRLWLLLGEAQSKVSHVANAPLLPELSRELHHVYLTKGVQGTTAIEGNTLTEEQVSAIVDSTSSLPVSQRYMEDEVRNILDAFNDYLRSGPRLSIDAGFLCDLNAAVLKNLPLEAGVFPGRFRQGRVTAGRYRAPSHHDVVGLVDDFVRWANSFDPSAQAEDAVAMGLVKAALAHIYFVWIHPFGDGNGRTARLIELDVLLAAGVPTPAAHLLSNHYNKTRAQYYRELDRARERSDPLGFVEYSVQGFVDGLREQIERIQAQQFEVLWARLVSEEFPGRTEANHRQARLAIEMARQGAPIKKGAIPRLCVELAERYAGKTSKTVTRDINRLLESGLVVEVGRRTYEANRRKVLSLLPARLA